MVTKHILTHIVWSCQASSAVSFSWCIFALSWPNDHLFSRARLGPGGATIELKSCSQVNYKVRQVTTVGVEAKL